MEFYEVVTKRLSVRSYSKTPIEKEKLDRIFAAARLAPSGKNAQPWHFILITDELTKLKLVSMMKNQVFVAEAPIIIVACGNPELAFPSQGDYMNAMPIDVAIAMEHLILAAAAEGLGTCWIGAFNETSMREMLGVPQSWRIVALTPLGYPNRTASARPRKELSEIISIENWSTPYKK